MRRFLSAGLLWLALVASVSALSVKAEKVYAPYQKIVLKATDYTKSEKESFLWNTPEGVETEAVGDKLYVWAPPGTYKITLTYIDFVAGKAEQTDTKFTVGKAPDPTPPPKPDPTPLPDGKFGLTKVSREAMAKVDSISRHVEAKKLADAHRKQASQTAAGVYSNVAEILEGWRAANLSALTEAERKLWEPWRTAIKEKVESLHNAGTLAGNNEWAAAFNEIADGLTPSNKKGK